MADWHFGGVARRAQLRDWVITLTLLFAPASDRPADLPGSGPLAPEASLRTLHTRPGFRVDLVAAEPLIQSPVAFDWGADGKLWVVEMRDYPLGMDNKGKPGGRIVCLEDT